MARLQSCLLSILCIFLFLVIHHPIRCNPVQSFRSTTNVVEIRTLPNGAHYIPDSGLTIRFSSVLSAVAPNAGAAKVLAEFYLRVLAKAIFEATARSPEVNNLFFTEGPLALIFAADSWGKTIPWDFVASFAMSMVQLTNRGFLATFDRGYWNADGTLGVYAGLRVEGLGSVP